ncbi:LacI family DNA-binding transcriptional regulator [Cohaesibacter intestini]|uniref:LacI family DNA-binding transcriptional regulator n=1 Tax=Cohaesibacter intestini TaxID=2211145 RepID=UPI000DE8FCC2|nr:LacI family DNA-binding transcriptional regulator [Cohaesibacter intestini]
MARRSTKAHVTIKDVAEAAGVSPMTVSRALRNVSFVTEETRLRIQQAVDQLGYVPNKAAGSLSSRKSGFVAMLLPSLNNQHLAETVHILTLELEKADKQLLLGYTDYLPDKEEELIETMLRHRPEALILCYDGHSQEARRRLDKVTIPVIELWETPDDAVQHTVGFSNFKAAYDMTRALLAKGYQRVAFLGEVNDEGSRAGARREGFTAAMQDAGLSAHRVTHTATMPISLEAAADTCNRLLDAFPDTDCIFCVSDPAAFGAMSALVERGVTIPDQIGLAGFGNFEISRFTHPPIATVGVDPVLIGKKAAELLLRILDQDGVGSSQVTEHIRLTPELMIRGSVTQCD